MPSPEPSARRIPQRKISETFLEFAAPILELASPDIGPAELQRALRIAELAWNAVALREEGREDLYLVWARELIAGLPDVERGVSIGILEHMFERREREYGDDPRLVSDVEVWRAEDGELRLRASARLPAGLER